MTHPRPISAIVQPLVARAQAVREASETPEWYDLKLRGHGGGYQVMFPERRCGFVTKRSDRSWIARNARQEQLPGDFRRQCDAIKAVLAAYNAERRDRTP